MQYYCLSNIGKQSIAFFDSPPKNRSQCLVQPYVSNKVKNKKDLLLSYKMALVPENTSGCVATCPLIYVSTMLFEGQSHCDC